MMAGDLPPETVLSLEAMKSLMFYAALAPEGGAVVEVGVYRGGSAWFLEKLGRPLYLYDTFDGMPYQGPLDGNEVGKFSDTSYEAVKAAIPRAQVIKGVFPHSLVEMPPLGFVHVDCDQYGSVKACIEVLAPRMMRHGIMIFDDYGVQDCRGATAAVQDSGRPFVVIANTGKAMMIF